MSNIIEGKFDERVDQTENDTEQQIVQTLLESINYHAQEPADERTLHSIRQRVTDALFLCLSNDSPCGRLPGLAYRGSIMEFTVSTAIIARTSENRFVGPNVGVQVRAVVDHDISMGNRRITYTLNTLGPQLIIDRETV